MRELVRAIGKEQVIDMFIGDLNQQKRHLQNFFMNNLPSLTDFGQNKDEAEIVKFLENLVFSSINKA